MHFDKTSIPDSSKIVRALLKLYLVDTSYWNDDEVLTVVGFRWLRHRVVFDNGVERGSISREDLATPAEFAKRLDGDAA